MSVLFGGQESLLSLDSELQATAESLLLHAGTPSCWKVNCWPTTGDSHPLILTATVYVITCNNRGNFHLKLLRHYKDTAVWVVPSFTLSHPVVCRVSIVTRQSVTFPS